MCLFELCLCAAAKTLIMFARQRSSRSTCCYSCVSGVAEEDQHRRRGGSVVASLQSPRARDWQSRDAERGTAQRTRSQTERPAHPQIQQAEVALRRNHSATESFDRR